MRVVPRSWTHLRHRTEDNPWQAFPGGEIYLSFPGLGDRLAAGVVAEIGEHIEQFDSSNALACYAGKAPVTRRSAKRRIRRRLPAGLQPIPARRGAAVGVLFPFQRSGWAREFYDRHIADHHSHHAALRALGNRWLGMSAIPRAMSAIPAVRSWSRTAATPRPMSAIPPPMAAIPRAWSWSRVAAMPRPMAGGPDADGRDPAGEVLVVEGGRDAEADACDPGADARDAEGEGDSGVAVAAGGGERDGGEQRDGHGDLPDQRQVRDHRDDDQ